MPGSFSEVRWLDRWRSWCFDERWRKYSCKQKVWSLHPRWQQKAKTRLLHRGAFWFYKVNFLWYHFCFIFRSRYHPNDILTCWLHRKKYELLQFTNLDDQFFCPFPPPQKRNSLLSHSTSSTDANQERRNYEKVPTKTRIGSAFRNSWGRKDSEHKNCKKGNALVLSSSMVTISE